jgi:hypothetical protein
MIFTIHSKKYGRHKVEIDDEDAKRVFQHEWHVNYQFRRGYMRAVSITSSINKKTIYLHRFILEAQKQKNYVVDHKDGNPLNNKKENLRICSYVGNAQNANVSIRNILKLKGVRYHSYGQYQARIQCAGKKYHLGLFASKEDAARAYNEAAKRLHGEFARLNVI